MEILEDVEESAVVAAFLLAELHSPRYGATIRSLLARARADAGLIERADLSSARENETRAMILGAYRGWPDRYLFHRFPRSVRWRRALLTTSDVGAALYINDDFRVPGREGWDKVSWFDLSRGSRHVADGAETVRRGRPEAGYEPVFSNILATAARMRTGAECPEMMMARASTTSPLLIVEGHTRATAYVVAGGEPVSVFVGEAPGLARWHLS